MNDILPGMELTSLYLHIPFCKQRCAYCDFNTYAGLESMIPEYVAALCCEVEWSGFSTAEKLPVHTIYFGGGTPSLLPLGDVGKILQMIKDVFVLHLDCEITLEANPGTLSREYLHGIRGLGINRLSIGMQSAHTSELYLLGRIHTYYDVINSVKWARAVGFENVNLDLIYGLPGQTLDDWQRSLELAIGLFPEHFSLYALTLEEDAMMERWIQHGLLDGQDADLAADMYELAETKLKYAGYGSYEISNWARYDGAGQLRACQHNLQYWRGKPYLGIGAGAHGFSDHIRTINVLQPQDYIKLMRESQPGKFTFPVTPATMEHKAVSRSEEMGEYMMMGLRLTQEGVAETDFLERFGLSLENKYGNKIERLIKLELLEWVNRPTRRLRLTKRGRLLGNQVFLEFI